MHLIGLLLFAYGFGLEGIDVAMAVWWSDIEKGLFCKQLNSGDSNLKGVVLAI